QDSQLLNVINDDELDEYEPPCEIKSTLCLVEEQATSEIVESQRVEDSQTLEAPNKLTESEAIRCITVGNSVEVPPPLEAIVAEIQVKASPSSVQEVQSVSGIEPNQKPASDENESQPDNLFQMENVEFQVDEVDSVKQANLDDKMVASPNEAENDHIQTPESSFEITTEMTKTIENERVKESEETRSTVLIMQPEPDVEIENQDKPSQVDPVAEPLDLRTKPTTASENLEKPYAAFPVEENSPEEQIQTVETQKPKPPIVGERKSRRIAERKAQRAKWNYFQEEERWEKIRPVRREEKPVVIETVSTVEPITEVPESPNFQNPLISFPCHGIEAVPPSPR
uniref:Uncharacterized protein n=1 Tax=Caenorhabditis japonica TaxID=281687 RepID=A0A8R1EKA5_CAEJA